MSRHTIKIETTVSCLLQGITEHDITTAKIEAEYSWKSPSILCKADLSDEQRIEAENRLCNFYSFLPLPVNFKWFKFFTTFEHDLFLIATPFTHVKESNNHPLLSLQCKDGSFYMPYDSSHDFFITDVLRGHEHIFIMQWGKHKMLCKVEYRGDSIKVSGQADTAQLIKKSFCVDLPLALETNGSTTTAVLDFEGQKIPKKVRAEILQAVNAGAFKILKQTFMAK